MILETISVGPLESNCYILASKKNSLAIIIDPGADEEKIRSVLNKHGLKPGIVVNTHGHYDHIGCDDKFGVDVFVHKDDAELLRDAGRNFSTFLGNSFAVTSEIKTLEDKQRIRLEEIELEVIHTPGHTPGGISLLMLQPENKILFTGDSLFYRSVGRTDFPGASHEQLIDAIKARLLGLADDTVIYPGHGPESTIGAEKRHNQYLMHK
ncbi:MAG: MBL fold metallo-hydrolase [Candidatus Omnitrophica bacterium]|nr:MBL fold metallo-hydrolase [Candidatus Omnitrophota bacterium]